MANVTYDADTQAIKTGSGGSSSFSHTVAVQPDRLLLVVVNSTDSGTSGTGTVDSATYNSVSMTRVTGSPIGFINLDSSSTEIFYLVAPATGSNTVAVNFTGQSGGTRRIVTAISFYNVHQSSPLGSWFSNGSETSAPSLNVTGTNGASLVLDSISFFFNPSNLSNATAGGGQTERWNRTEAAEPGSTGDFMRGAGSTEPGGGTITMSWSLDAGTETVSHAAIEIKPVLPAVTVIQGASGAGIGIFWKGPF